MRALALVYVSLLLGVVVAADVGVLGPLVRGVHAIPLGDKLCHLVLATGLGYFAAAMPRVPRVGASRLPVTTPFVIVVALLEELSQRFIPGRTFDLADLAADALGLALGTTLALRAVTTERV